MTLKKPSRFCSSAIVLLCSLTLLVSPIANVANAQTYQTPQNSNPSGNLRRQNSNEGGTDSTRINRTGSPYPGGAAYSGNGSSVVSCNYAANNPIITQTSCPAPQVGTISTRSDYACASGYEPGVYGAPYETARSCQSACWAFAKPASAYGPSDNAWTVVPFVTGVTDALADPFAQTSPAPQTYHYITNSWVGSLAYVASEGYYCTSQPNPPIDYCINMAGDQTAIPSNGYGTYSWNSSTMVCCPQAENRALTCGAAGYPYLPDHVIVTSSGSFALTESWAGAVNQNRAYACSTSGITPGSWAATSDSCTPSNANMFAQVGTAHSPCGTGFLGGATGGALTVAWTDANGVLSVGFLAYGIPTGSGPGLPLPAAIFGPPPNQVAVQGNTSSAFASAFVTYAASGWGSRCDHTMSAYATVANGVIHLTALCQSTNPASPCYYGSLNPKTGLRENVPAANALGLYGIGGTIGGYGHTDVPF